MALSDTGGAMPLWAKGTLGAQFLLAALLLLFGWSETVTNARGRPIALLDLALLSTPVLAVVLCAVVARVFFGRGRTGLAILATFAPLPLAFVLFAVSGAI